MCNQLQQTVTELFSSKLTLRKGAFKMKFYLALILICAVVLCVSSESISEDEVAELISDYNHLYKNYEGERNAPVCTS